MQERMVKELVRKEMLKTRAHLRDLAFVDEMRRGSQDQSLEMAALVTEESRGK